MSKWMLWMLLFWLTGSPLRAVVLLVLILWVLDRFTARLLPSPARAWGRWRRRTSLEHTLAVNPHDRRSRLELAEILIERGRHERAVELLKPNLEAGDHDATTLFVLGVACFGAGRAKQGEVFLSEAREVDPKYRGGAIELELGRGRLGAGDAAGAKQALETFLALSPGSVEARVLLSKACEALGDHSGAEKLRAEAWREYVITPRFRRRVERPWAWRARPSRPAIYAVMLLLGLGLSVLSWTQLKPAMQSMSPQSEAQSPFEDEGF